MLLYLISTYNLFTVNGFFYLGGVVHETGSNHIDWILKLDKNTLQWVEVGKMSQTRYNHAMSVVNVEDVKDYCI